MFEILFSAKPKSYASRGGTDSEEKKEIFKQERAGECMCVCVREEKEGVKRGEKERETMG